jgi:hypothetical protein
MAEGFQVDLTALRQAARAVHDSLDSIHAMRVPELGQDTTAFGHDRLGSAVTDFCSHWATGVQHLTTDAQAFASQLSACTTGYHQGDQTAREHLNEILQGNDRDP